MKKNNGITLIALVITIIVLLILAGISIAMLTGDNGILNKAITSKEEQIKAEMKEQLILAIQDLQLGQRGNATLDDITQEWTNEKLKEYEGIIIENIEGKKIKMKKNGVTGRFIIDLNLNVTHIEYDGSIEFAYKEKERNGNNVKISIYIQDEENGINKIELPNLEPYMGNGTKEEILLDYEVEIGKEYKIIITSENGEKIEGTVLIMNYYYVTTNFGEGIDIDNKITKVIYNQPYKAKIIEKGDYILDDFSVMMNGETINVDNFVGTIDIEKVTGDIEITATSKKVTNLIDIKEANAVYICDEYVTNNNTLIQEKLFNGNIDERRTV